MIFFDTSAWVEYFIGSAKGLKIKNILESENEKIATPIIALIELRCKAYKENIDFDSQINFIKQKSIIVNLTEEAVLSIGKMYVEMKRKSKKTSLADAIIATMSRSHNAILVTCDTDFKGLDNVEFI